MASLQESIKDLMRWLAKDKLRRLRHFSTVDEYIHSFENVANNSCLSEEELIGFFMNGLQEDFASIVRANNSLSLQLAMGIAEIQEWNFEYTAKKAKHDVGNVKQMGSVEDYINSFELVINKFKVSEKFKVDSFLKGLKKECTPWMLELKAKYNFQNAKELARSQERYSHAIKVLEEEERKEGELLAKNANHVEEEYDQEGESKSSFQEKQEDPVGNECLEMNVGREPTDEEYDTYQDDKVDDIHHEIQEMVGDEVEDEVIQENVAPISGKNSVAVEEMEADVIGIQDEVHKGDDIYSVDILDQSSITGADVELFEANPCSVTSQAASFFSLSSSLHKNKDMDNQSMEALDQDLSLKDDHFGEVGSNIFVLDEEQNEDGDNKVPNYEGLINGDFHPSNDRRKLSHDLDGCYSCFDSSKLIQGVACALDSDHQKDEASTVIILKHLQGVPTEYSYLILGNFSVGVNASKNILEIVEVNKIKQLVIIYQGKVLRDEPHELDIQERQEGVSEGCGSLAIERNMDWKECNKFNAVEDMKIRFPFDQEMTCAKEYGIMQAVEVKGIIKQKFQDDYLKINDDIFTFHRKSAKQGSKEVYKILMKMMIIIWSWFYKENVIFFKGGKESLKHPGMWIEDWRIAWILEDKDL